MAAGSCCCGFFFIIITVGPAFLIVFLSSKVNEPRCYVEHIYVPALDKTLTSPPNNNTVFFTLKLVSRNRDEGVEYDDVRVSFCFFVGPNATRHVGNATVEGFYQGRGEKAFKSGSLLAAGNLTVPVNGGTAVYRVDFATAVRYETKRGCISTKRYRLWGGANVEISHSGLKLYPEPLRLGDSPVNMMIHTGARKLRPCYRARARALLLPLCVAAGVLMLLLG